MRIRPTVLFDTFERQDFAMAARWARIQVDADSDKPLLTVLNHLSQKNEAFPLDQICMAQVRLSVLQGQCQKEAVPEYWLSQLSPEAAKQASREGKRHGGRMVSTLVETRTQAVADLDIALKHLANAADLLNVPEHDTLDK
jgi:hypothetical protein